MPDWTIRLLETPEEMTAVEALQRLVWSGSETEITPAHMLLAMAHNGGLVLGAFTKGALIGVVLGFPGLYWTADGPRPKHCSHQLGVHPDWRDSGLGFALKRAQWQMVRHQGIDRITWTYDPLLSRNAYLNISKLGAVCNTYRSSEYGEMRDDLNVGLPSDRFQVDWWILTKRVERRLSRRARKTLNLDHYTSAGIQLISGHRLPSGLLCPVRPLPAPEQRILLVEIPVDFPGVRNADQALALDWRLFGREVFESIFAAGYLITDFIYDTTIRPARSFYVAAHGESILEA